MSVHSVAAAGAGATRVRTLGDVVRFGAVAAGLAVVANLAVLTVGRVAGADMVVGEAGAADTVGVVAVVSATLIGLVAGTLLLVVLRERGARAWTAVAAAGLVVGILTAPAAVFMTAEPATQTTLGAMHVVAGLVWFLMVRRGTRG